MNSALCTRLCDLGCIGAHLFELVGTIVRAVSAAFKMGWPDAHPSAVAAPMEVNRDEVMSLCITQPVAGAFPLLGSTSTRARWCQRFGLSGAWRGSLPAGFGEVAKDRLTPAQRKRTGRA